ncbi:MAG: GNAT family N-acetyltransferase [Lachnospiraceae bacterium]|nr:GNAT family N-acetyltransferase [Lachnospiraceae bacterium]
MEITGKRVYLRAMEAEDMEMYREMMNDGEISRQVVGWSFPVSQKEQSEWYNKAVFSADKRFTICLKENGKAVGMATLTDIDWVNRSAFHGIKLHPDCPKRENIGTDAVMALMEYAFCQLNLHRLDGAWLVSNTASAGLYKKCGWKEEGIKKEAVFRDGAYRDLAISGIRDVDYAAIRETLAW